MPAGSGNWYIYTLSIEAGRVPVRENLGGELRWIEADSVVLAWYGVADDALARALRAREGLDVHVIGDCLAPRRVIDAIWGRLPGRRGGMSRRGAAVRAGPSAAGSYDAEQT